jgi:hypothetical protein
MSKRSGLPSLLKSQIEILYMPPQNIHTQRLCYLLSLKLIPMQQVRESEFD